MDTPPATTNDGVLDGLQDQDSPSSANDTSRQDRGLNRYGRVCGCIFGFSLGRYRDCEGLRFVITPTPQVITALQLSLPR